MVKWDQKLSAWSGKMRRYAAADPKLILYTLFGEIIFTTGWDGIKVNDGIKWDIAKFAQAVHIREDGIYPVLGLNLNPIVIDYDNLVNAFIVADLSLPFHKSLVPSYVSNGDAGKVVESVRDRGVSSTQIEKISVTAQAASDEQSESGYTASSEHRSPKPLGAAYSSTKDIHSFGSGDDDDDKD